MRYLIAANYLMQYCLLLVFLFTILYIFTHKYLKPKEQTFALFFFFLFNRGKKHFTGIQSLVGYDGTWKKTNNRRV